MLDAPVKYNGVDVGKVRQIRLDPGNPQQVNLLFAIERGTPIREDTVAVLKTQGLTGIAYIELSGGTRDSPPLRATRRQRLSADPHQALARCARVDNLLTTVLTKLDSLSNNVNAILSDANRKAFADALADIAVVAHTIAARKDALDSGITHAARTFENASRATAQVGPVIDRLGRSADAVGKMGKRGRPHQCQRPRRRSTRSAPTCSASARKRSPNWNGLLEELTVLSASLRRLSEQTERNPASLLFGRRPVPDGPGESSSSGARTAMISSFLAVPAAGNAPSACSLTLRRRLQRAPFDGTAAPPAFYALEQRADRDRSRHGPAPGDHSAANGAPALVVNPPHAPRRASTAQRILYVRDGAYQLEYFAHSEWVDPPARMLAPLIVAAAREQRHLPLGHPGADRCRR
jgi:phospholipid/cholesterol/gamma-HCH transport system substrate-binding protein